MTLLLHLSGIDEAPWKARFADWLGCYPVVGRNEAFDPDSIRYIFCWKPGPDAFEGLNNLKAVLSYGAGVDALLSHPDLPKGVPVVRFVDEDLSERMSDYVVANVAMHHRLHTLYQTDQQSGRWSKTVPLPASGINVGVMGLGVLGRVALARLQPQGYGLLGWSRTSKTIAGVQCHSGEEEFPLFLENTDILVNLLPLTPQTAGILNYSNFGRLRRGVLEGGPAVINAARGGHQSEADLVRALSDGTLGAASLDVFEIEPLPATSPLWPVRNCYITPHISAVSDPERGARYFAKTIIDHEAGKPLSHVVDMVRGY